jgi:transposase
MKESGTFIMLYERIKLQGQSISEVARETGLSRVTIRKYLSGGEQAHKSKGTTKVSKLDAYKGEVDRLLQQGIYNCQVIFDRIEEQGLRQGQTPACSQIWSGRQAL